MLTKGGGGVREMLTLADEGGRWGLDPPFLADIICEQSLMQEKQKITYFKSNERYQDGRKH